LDEGTADTFALVATVARYALPGGDRAGCERNQLAERGAPGDGALADAPGCRWLAGNDLPSGRRPRGSRGRNQYQSLMDGRAWGELSCNGR
jgi:hypothetical protein